MVFFCNVTWCSLFAAMDDIPFMISKKCDSTSRDEVSASLTHLESWFAYDRVSPNFSLEVRVRTAVRLIKSQIVELQMKLEMNASMMTINCYTQHTINVWSNSINQIKL